MNKDREYLKQDLTLGCGIGLVALALALGLTGIYGPKVIQTIDKAQEAERIRALTPTATWVMPTPYPTQPSFDLSLNTQIPILTNPALKKEDCVIIGKKTQNAYRAWHALGQPDELGFCNLAGPDATGSCEEIDYCQLPQLVHKGDQFCNK